jgi:hypothetical protein
LVPLALWSEFQWLMLKMLLEKIPPVVQDLGLALSMAAYPFDSGLEFGLHSELQ